MDRRQLFKSFLAAGCAHCAGAVLPFGSLLLGREMSEQERYKMRHFDKTHSGDIFLPKEKSPLLLSLTKKLERVQAQVGYGFFNLLSFDEMLKVARDKFPFTVEELAFFEEIFYEDATKYGFLGPKQNVSLTEKVAAKDVVKIPRSGHYLLKATSLPIYKRILEDVGHSLILTSGVRGVVKQTYLFFAKARSTHGNLSQASRSLAPPGFSYHAVGDFDVGKIGLGLGNFTERFSQTTEYKKLIDLGYVDIRYPFENPFGVRFEPWHIKGLRA